MSEGNLLPWMGTDFSTDILADYQTEGGVIRNLVRTRDFSGAAKHEFKLRGASKAVRRAIGSAVPVSNVTKTAVAVSMEEDAVGETFDETELLGQNVDGKQVALDGAKMAIARAADHRIYTAIRANGNVSVQGGASGARLTFDSALAAYGVLLKNKIKSNLCAVVGPMAWLQLMQVKEFTSADYVGANGVPLPEMKMGHWMGFDWILDPELMPETGTVEDGFIFEKSQALGYGFTKSVTAKWSWENKDNGWFLNTNIVHGAVVINPKGVVRMKTAF